MKTVSHQELLDLLNEFAFWYQELAKKGPLPRALSGINAQGEQFLIRLDNLALEHPERHALIRTILSEEQAVCYAYGGVKHVLRGQQEGTERVTLIVAIRDYYVMGEWAVHRAPSIRLEQRDFWEGDNPKEVPSAWFLTNVVNVGANTERYRSIWRALRPQALFLQRPMPLAERE